MEPNQEILNLAHYRSKERIRDLGEVFTPDKYVQEMLNMLDKKVWSDTNAVFFEPTCGHGNFVEVILKRRLKALFESGKRNKDKNRKPHFYAVAYALNNLWAIDIDSKNIEFCKARVWSIVSEFLLEKQSKKLNLKELISKNKDFFIHIFCCINYQIHENEALSCLESNPFKAKEVASKTIISKKWFKKNKHRPIDFELSWCEYFRALKESGAEPMEYRRASKFLESLSVEKRRKNNDSKRFDFAQVA